ncbi:ABC transporter permease [Nesterenkonia populi]
MSITAVSASSSRESAAEQKQQTPGRSQPAASPKSARAGFRLSERGEDVLLSLLGLAFFLGLWIYLGATTRFVLPLGEVVASMPEFLADISTWAVVFETWLRVILSLSFGLLLGCGFAVLMWKTKFWGSVSNLYVSVLLSIPSTISALLGVFIFYNAELGSVVVLGLTIAPFIAVIVYGALRRLDGGLAEMAVTYRFSRWQRTTTVVFPQIAAALMSAVRNEHAHTWKVVVIVELFMVSSGMGFEFNRAFELFNLMQVYQWLIVFAAILLATEYLVIRPLEKQTQRWKA